MRRPAESPLALIAGSIALAGSLLAGCQRDTWTTDSPEARAEYQQCLETQMKFYFAEALRHCERALELDPGFTAAKLRVALAVQEFDHERAQKLFDEIRQADLERLTPRERFLVRYHLDLRDKRPEDAEALLEEYLVAHPEDPWAINLQCFGPWRRQEWDEAEACYRKLLDTDPNWVIAQNHLGYIAMARGRFAEAEEQFETYRFIAPDQANPHDSLGELLTLVGRYDDATQELEEALTVRPDFCASYDHLFRISMLQLEFDRAEEVLARRRQQEACREMNPQELGCSLDVWRPFARRDWGAAWQAAHEDGCLEAGPEMTILAHSAAVHAGRRDDALELENRLQEKMKKAQEYGKVDRDVRAAMLAHMQGTRLEEEGDLEAAAERYSTADRLLRYWTADGWSYFKLFNQLSLADALHESGEVEGEEAVLERVRAVNPRMVVVFYRGDGSVR